MAQPGTVFLLLTEKRQRSGRCLVLKKRFAIADDDLRLAAKIVPEIVPVVIVPEVISMVVMSKIVPMVITPEIISMVIVSAVIGIGMRRYDHGRRSPESRHPDTVLTVISIHPDVTRSRTGGPHHRHGRGRADTDTY